MNVIQKLKKSGLLGRGGANFPTGIKWEMVKKAKSDRKYIIANASEGEPGVFKDQYLLENFPEEVITGIEIALKTIDHSEGFLYLRKDLYGKLGNKLRRVIKKNKINIELVKKPGGYLCGEETTLIESMEGKRFEPRMKPPYPPQKGLHGKPTLVNNIETFYAVSKIIKNEYQNTRFYCVSGMVKVKKIYELPIDWSVKEILKHASPDLFKSNKNFFVQVGGGACGEIRAGKDLNKPICGVGSIIVYPADIDTVKLMKKWINFYIKQNCGKCTPCREGIYRIRKILSQPKISKANWTLMKEILLTMSQTSFCGLGLSMPTSFLSLMKYKKIK